MQVSFAIFAAFAFHSIFFLSHLWLEALWSDRLAMQAMLQEGEANIGGCTFPCVASIGITPLLEPLRANCPRS